MKIVLNYLFFSTANTTTLRNLYLTNGRYIKMSNIKIINTLLVIVFLYGCGGSGEKTVSVPITANTKPTANAGDDQNAETGVVVTLDGEKSTDKEKDILTYQWSLVTVPEGSSVELTEFTTISTSFSPDKAGLFEAQLIVNDGILSSEPSTVRIIVTKANVAPIAIAGMDVETYVGMTVFLDGGASFDPENSELSYSWSVIASPEDYTGTIHNADTKKAQLLSTIDGDYILQLTVTDNEGASSESDIMITLNKLGQKDITLLTQELIDNKAKWESQNITHYQIDQHISCFCSETTTIPVTMQVQEEDKNLLYYTPNSDWYGARKIDRAIMVSNSDEYSFKTVNGMFDSIETAITDADQVTVSYHPELGYPQSVIIDWQYFMVDDEISFSLANLINLSDANCDVIEKNYPNIKLNIVDEHTAKPISCDVHVEWQHAKGELQQVVNDGYLPQYEFGIVGIPISCIDNIPLLLSSEAGMVSLTIAKTGYITKTAEYSISGDEACGLIPTDIEVKLEPVN